MSEQQPNKRRPHSAALDPHLAIAREVECRLDTLSVMCSYMGWINIAQQLKRSRTELLASLKQPSCTKNASGTLRRLGKR